MTYEGWTNYETWAVKLHIDNEEASYHHWRQATRESYAVDSLADALKEQHQEAMPELQAGSVWADLLQAAFSDVDWHEIAQSLLDDIAEELSR